MARPKRLLLVVLVCLLGASAGYGQEVRASIRGTVTDPSGAPVPNASITVTHVAQNVSVTTRSNEAGNFLSPFLAPGTYRLAAEAPGFKKAVRENIGLQAQDMARVDVQLEIGSLTESVTVRESVSMLQTETATRSQTITNELIANVPTQGRNPFQVAWSAAGVIKAGDWRYLRSFDIGGTSGFSVNGGRNKENEVLLDGISNVQGDRTVIHVPTMDSVQEFKVVTNTYDAQYGRTGGGVMTIVTKQGGNAFHGTVYEYFQNDKLNANSFELNAAGRPRQSTRINTFGFQTSGPVYVPKAFDGRNRLFWMLAYEGIRQRTPDAGVATFPLTEWRTGDFSTLRNAQGQPVLIYDPTTTLADGSRRPFADNKIPADRINRVATEILKFYPGPNSAGDGPAHINNYIYPSRWTGGLDQWIGRADYVINSRNNFFFRYGQNPWHEFRSLVWDGSNAAEPSGNAPLIRNGRNWTFDWTSTLSPRMTFNLRAGLNRWEETTGNIYGAGFDPRKLGFADSLVAQFSKLQFPNIGLVTYQGIGSSRLLNYTTDDTYTIQPNSNLVVGKHFLKFGWEGRQYKDNKANPGMASGTYTFDKNWTRANSARSDAVSGNELATFLLGYPTSGSVDRNIDPGYVHRYYALYLNDDWKVRPRLTLNLGLRWDYETPPVERYNRMLRGFDFNMASPIASRVSGLTLKGGVMFAGANSQPRTAFEPDKNNFQPRLGAAYRVGNRWVIRSGYGLYYLGQNDWGASQGYSRTTSVTTSVDGGLTPAVNLTNPFANQPGGLLLAAIGNSLGAASFLGESITVAYLNRPLAYSHQYSLDIERELPGNLLIEAGYVGNLTRNVPLSFGVDVLPASELGHRTAAGVIDTAYYTAQLPNPMAGLIPNNAALNGATITRQNLLRPYPQYSGISLAVVPIGKQRYDGFQSKVTKRYSQGISFVASYTIMKNLEQASALNNQDFVLSNPESTRLEKRSAGQIDIPQKFVVAGVFDLPVGRNKKFAAHARKAVDYLVGGWQLGWNVTYQSGWLPSYPNAKQVKPGSAKLSNPTFAQWFDTSLWNDPTTGKRVAAQESQTLRDYPTLFGDVRLPGYKNWDTSVSKYFPIHEHVRLQFRCEMINMMNHVWFAALASGGNDVTNANFGRLDPTQRNLPRFVKLALNLQW
jgi:hypothetical protein